MSGIPGAGDGGPLPGAAVTPADDAGYRGYLGPAPPPGNGPDRSMLRAVYFFHM
ncbi:hypothetical protein [Streptomyces sp. Ag109_O5-10]|uniref:hypothetical protein n=1 Tax=Streptomyces sp. Ag109_O5-10 TaxID=1855349 RepID=UPI0015A5CD34|nr:hypothetical protein [Streptomyces sp. Ag109_O5-10]